MYRLKSWSSTSRIRNAEEEEGTVRGSELLGDSPLLRDLFKHFESDFDRECVGERVFVRDFVRDLVGL